MTRILFLILLFFTIDSWSGTLLIDAIRTEPANNEAGLPRPAHDQTMAQVTRRFGDPTAVLPAVGKPPITRWRYPQYMVYFEYDRVLDTVVYR